MSEGADSGRAGSPPVVVAVVSFNTRELLMRCLDSLRGDVAAGRAEVWVVDNASSDGSADAVRARAPWARVLEPGANLGYGRAVNLVAERTSSEWLLAANADVAFTPGALATLLAGSEAPGDGCLVPRLILPDGQTQHSVHPFPTVPLTLLFNLGIHHLSSRLADRLCLEGHWNPARARTVPWAIGACLMLRRAAYDAVGGFDERQWMYAEDLDLGWRLRAGSWSTRYVPSARVQHESGAATNPAFGDMQTARFMVASYETMLLRRGAARTWAVAAINIAGAAARLLWTLPLVAFSGRFRTANHLARRWLRAHAAGIRAASRAERGGQAGRAEQSR